MAHEVMQSPHPSLSVLRLYADLAKEDLICADEVGLNEGRPIYLLTDASQVTLGLPERFLETMRNSILYNPNLAHNAVYITSSGMIKSLANMVVKFTRSQTKVTIHSNYDEAQNCLLKLIQEAGL